jgi:hypothetical protein
MGMIAWTAGRGASLRKSWVRATAALKSWFNAHGRSLGSLPRVRTKPELKLGISRSYPVRFVHSRDHAPYVPVAYRWSSTESSLKLGELMGCLKNFVLHHGCAPGNFFPVPPNGYCVERGGEDYVVMPSGITVRR